MSKLEEMRSLVSKYTKFVYDNHEDFLELISTADVWTLTNISFGEDSIKLVYVLWGGQHISDSLDYSIFEKWYETRSLQIQA